MMYDNMQSAKRYAVVKFKLDSTYCEIPAIWLIENNVKQWCLWPPRTANSATLISDYATPNYNTWDQYEVEIIKFYSSLESARQNAANYQTINEERLGKRKRHIPCNRYSNEKEEDETNSPVCKHNKIKKENDFSEINEYLEIDKMPVTFEGYNTIDPTSTQNKEEDLDIKQNIKKILHMQAAANIMLQDVNQRLIKIETALKNPSKEAFNVVKNSDTLIAKFLPLTTIDNIKEFNVLLKTTNEAVTQFKEFISKIGGNNARDNIHRTLGKIFTNECAMNCSWKGLRNNFRIVDLYITKLMRREIVSRNTSLTESEFDNVAAEWLRFAKQRKQRYDKAIRNEEDNQ